MRLEPRDRARLLDMLSHAQDAVALLSKADIATLKADLGMRHGVVRCVEIIGEAGHLISSDVQAQLPSIPWHLMYAMRNRLIHD